MFFASSISLAAFMAIGQLFHGKPLPMEWYLELALFGGGASAIGYAIASPAVAHCRSRLITERPHFCASLVGVLCVLGLIYGPTWVAMSLLAPLLPPAHFGLSNVFAAMLLVTAGLVIGLKIFDMVWDRQESQARERQ